MSELDNNIQPAIDADQNEVDNAPVAMPEQAIASTETSAVQEAQGQSASTEAQSSYSTMSLVSKTMPYFILRAVVYLLVIVGFIALAIIFLLITSSFAASAASGVAVILGAGFLMVSLSIWRFLKSYLLYMVKAGHVAVVSALIRGNSLPDGQGQISYGTSMVKKYFATANVMWVLDNLVSKAVVEIKKGIDTLGDALDFIPGMNMIQGFLAVFVSIFLGYSDEAILGHIFLSNEKNIYKSAADGVVLYAQNWKELMKSAAVMALGLLVVGGVTAAAGYGSYALATLLSLEGAIILAILVGVALLVKWVFVDPVVMIFMLNKYINITSGQEPSVDLYAKLKSISGKFTKIVEKSAENQA